MNFVNSAKKYQYEISHAMHIDDIISGSNAYDKLDDLCQSLIKAVNEIKLIKMHCLSQIISKIKKIRSDMELINQPDITIDELQSLQLKESIREVAPNISLQVISVPTEEFIPDSPLYYLRASDEYAIKVQGLTIKGNIQNIRTNKVSDGWSASNFLYTKEPLMAKNITMRHIGSRDTLITEIYSATQKEKNLRNKQLAHDLLIGLCIWGIGGANRP